MVKCIVLEYPNGTIAIRGGIGPGTRARFNGNEDAARQHILDNLVPVQNPTATARIEDVTFPPDKQFRKAWRAQPGIIVEDMPVSREVHAERIAVAQVVEIARLKVEERKERIKGNTAQADTHAATVTALEVLDLNVLATQIAAAPNPAALKAIWPAQLPRS